MNHWTASLDERHRWWDDSPVVTLFHGTSSALLDRIRTEGLKPPSNLRTLAHDVLEDYVPRERWTQGLLEEVEAHAIRSELGRSGDNGPVLFLCTSPDKVRGYAESAASHGGEIAHNVWESACLHVAPHLTWREFRENPPLSPRFPAAEPLVLAVEIPKAWCLWRQDPTTLKTQLTHLWAQRDADTEGHETLASYLDEALDQGVEVRVPRTIPPEMICVVRADAILHAEPETPKAPG